jgi:hypothetical protein
MARAECFLFFEKMLHRDEMKLILGFICNGDIFVLALQSKDLHLACYNEYTKRMQRIPAQVRWYTTASCTEARLDWARHEFPHPHRFVPNAKSLEVIALQGDVALYEKLCEEMPALKETFDVYRKAGASGEAKMIIHLLIKNNNTNAHLDDRADNARCMLAGAALFNHVSVLRFIPKIYVIRSRDEILDQAMRNGSVDVVKFMINNDAFPRTEEGLPEPFQVLKLFERSMKHGRHEILRVVHEFFEHHLIAFPQQEENVRQAVSEHLIPPPFCPDEAWVREWPNLTPNEPQVLETFKYAIEKMRIPYLSYPPVVAMRTTRKAIALGDLGLVTYIHEKLHPVSQWDVSTWCTGLQCTSSSFDMATHVYKLHPHIPDNAMNKVIRNLLSDAAYYHVRSRICRVGELEKQCMLAIDWLVARNVQCTCEHVTTAVSYGSVSVLNALVVKHGAPVDSNTVLEHAMRMMNPEVVMFGEYRLTRFRDMVHYLRTIHEAQWTASCLRDAAAYHQSYKVSRSQRWPDLFTLIQQMIAEGVNPEHVQDAALRRRLSLRPRRA